MILKTGVSGYSGGDLSFACDGEARGVAFKGYYSSFVQQLHGDILESYS